MVIWIKKSFGSHLTHRDASFFSMTLRSRGVENYQCEVRTYTHALHNQVDFETIRRRTEYGNQITAH